MSISVKKYPTSAGIGFGWTDRANATGSEDDLCATCTIIGVGDLTMPLSSYGFALPVDAIIDNVYIDMKALYTNSDNILFPSGLEFMIKKTTPPSIEVGVGGYGYLGTLGEGCTDTFFYGELDVQPIIHFVASDFNTVNFTTKVHAYLATAGTTNYYFVDAAYIRVVYHLPTVRARGDGLTWIVAMAKLRDAYRNRFPPLLMRQL